MVIPEFIGMYGLDDYAFSMKALKDLTQFSSSEFAVREFIRHDINRTISMMTEWANDENHHVRRLASEGSRPRLPWSFRITELILDPSPVPPILERLRCENHPYVKKTVANHLNDISKDNTRWMLDYVVHYVKNNGDKRPKVFKLKELTLKPGETVTINKKHRFENFTTRKHYPGMHDIEIKVNGLTMAKKRFELKM